MTKDKEAQDLMAELTDLELDPQDFEDLLAAARLTQQARTALPTADDASTVVLPAVAIARSPPPPTAPPSDPHSHPFASKYAADGLLKSHASLVKPFLDADEDKARELLIRYQAYDPNERPCFVVCTSSPKPRLRVLHGLDIYPLKMANSSPFDNNPYVFHGDAFQGNTPPSYLVEPTWFQMDRVIVPAIKDFDEACKTTTTSTVGTPGAKTSNSKSICVIPTNLAPLLMEQPLTPTAAWPILRAFAAKQSAKTQLAPFFAWLSILGHKDNHRVRVDSFTPADMEMELHARRTKIVRAILGKAPAIAPTLVQTPSGPDHSTTAIQLLAATLAKALPTAKAAPVAKTPATRWLLRVCQVPDENHLNTVWWKGAKCKKSDFRGILTVLLRERAEALKLPIPYANHRLASKVHDQEFAPTNEFDLTNGFSIWDFPELTPAELASQLEHTREWTEHLEGGNNPSLSETRTAMKGKKNSPVLTFMQLFAHVAHFEVFLDVCFGNMHPTVTELNYLRSYLQDEQFRMERAMVADRFLGSQIVTMIRLQITGLLRSACSTAGRVFMPDLQSMTNALRFGTLRPPNLPRSITSLLYHPPGQTPGTSFTQPQAVVSQQRPPTAFYTEPAPTGQQNNPPTLSRGEQIRNYAFNTAWL